MCLCRSARARFDAGVDRSTFVSRQDVRNALHAIQAEESYLDMGDSVSFDAAVHALCNESDSPVLCYKPASMQDSFFRIPDEEVVLILASHFQLDAIEKHVRHSLRGSLSACMPACSLLRVPCRLGS